jgi:biopolymer transport protein ExbD
MAQESKTKIARARRSQDMFGGRSPVLLTPLVDMFVILLIFLLLSYSTGGHLMYMARNVLMPESVSREQLEPAVEIAVATDRIYVDGEVIMDDLTEWYTEKKLLMPVLYENLKLKALEFKKLEEEVPLFYFAGKVTIQADRALPFHVLKKVLYTADRADFPRISLAVYQRD